MKPKQTNRLASANKPNAASTGTYLTAIAALARRRVCILGISAYRVLHVGTFD